MQEARGSTPLSSTFSQVKGILRALELALERLQPSKFPELEFLARPRSMQVRRMLYALLTAVPLASALG